MSIPPFITFNATNDSIIVGPNLDLTTVSPITTANTYTPVLIGVGGCITAGPVSITGSWHRLGNIVKVSVGVFGVTLAAIPGTANITLPILKSATANPVSGVASGYIVTQTAPFDGAVSTNIFSNSTAFINWVTPVGGVYNFGAEFSYLV